VKPGQFTLANIGHAIPGFAGNPRDERCQEFLRSRLGRGFPCRQILHYGRPQVRVLEPALFFTSRPLVNLGRGRTRLLADDWTAVTATIPPPCSGAPV